MRFKTSRAKSEYEAMATLEHGPKLLAVAATFEALSIGMTGITPTVTSIYRSESEQAALCDSMGVEFYRSVHMYWRGIDLSVRPYTRAQVHQLKNALVESFDYGLKNNGKQGSVCVVHVGTAKHFHLQVKACSGSWK